MSSCHVPGMFGYIPVNPLQAKSQPGMDFSNHNIFERALGPTRHIHTPQIHIEYTPLHCFIKSHV